MKRVIVFGASSGMGRLLAEAYAREGCLVAAAARRMEKLEELRRKYPRNIKAFQVDVSRFPAEQGGEASESVRGRFFAMTAALGGADLVIYSAGMGKQNREFNMQVVYDTVEVNAKAFTAAAAATVEYGASVPHRVQFVTISSIAAVRGIGVSPSYSATKMYQVRYMEALRQLDHVQGWGMDFTTILPGFVDTDFIRGRHYPMTMPASYAVRRIKRAIDARRKYKIIDWRWALVVALWKMIPNWLWYKLPVK